MPTRFTPVFRFTTVVWLAWAATAVFLTAGTVRWHVEYFRNPGPQFYRAALIGLPLLALGALAWAHLRTRFLWRYELPTIALIPLAAALVREPRATLVIAGLFAACYCAGRALCARRGWSTDALAADLVFSTAAGFALLNVVLFAGGVARLWYPWFFALLILAPLVVFHRNLGRLIRTLRAIFRRWTELEDLRRPIVGILIPFAAILAICTTLLMLAPTLSWDAMKEEFPLAQHYLEFHGLEPKLDLIYSYFPQATESIFTLAWALGGPVAPQFVTPLFFALSLLTAWILARDCGAEPDAAFAGVMLAASLPAMHWTVTVPKTDGGVTFFLLVSLAAALRWRAHSDFKWVQAGVLFLAAAFATKDLAILGAVPLGFAFLPAAWRQPRRLRAFASLAAIFGIVAVIWTVRRWALTGNPLFQIVPAGQIEIPNWPLDPSSRGTILRMLQLPWKLLFRGHAFTETPLIAPLGLAFIFFWPVWLFSRRTTPAERLCLGFGIVTFLLWGWRSPVLRYAAAPLEVLALLTGARLAQFWRNSTVVTRASLAAICLWVMIPAICATMIIEVNAPQLRYLTGGISRDEYLSQSLITYRSLAWLRDHTAPAERILGLENCSDMYAPPFPRYRSLCGFKQWTATEVETQLRAMRFDWLVAPASDQPADLAAARTAGREAVEMYRDPNFVIYRLN